MQKLHSPRTKRLWCLCVASFRKLSNPVVLARLWLSKGLRKCVNTVRAMARVWLQPTPLSNVKKGSDIDWGAVTEQMYCISSYPLHITYESTIDSKKKGKEEERLKTPLLFLLVLHGMSSKDMLLLIWRNKSSIPGMILSCKLLCCVGFGNIRALENIKEHLLCKRKWEKGHKWDKKTAQLGLREKSKIKQSTKALHCYYNLLQMIIKWR